MNLQNSKRILEVSFAVLVLNSLPQAAVLLSAV